MSASRSFACSKKVPCFYHILLIRVTLASGGNERIPLFCLLDEGARFLLSRVHLCSHIYSLDS